MHIRLLGPIDVTVDGIARPVTGQRRKAVLAVLGLSAGEVVSNERLMHAVWGDRPPATGLNALQRHISYLRGVFGDPKAIGARTPGYVIDRGADTTDVQVAERLIRRAGRSHEPEAAAADLRRALGLWRGEPLADVVGLPWFHAHAERLSGMRLDAAQALVEVRLRLGEHTQLIPDLEELVRRHPYREQVHGQLMLALYRAGRQAEALAAYDRFRVRLAGDLGVDPGAAIRRLHGSILRQDPDLDPPAPPAVRGDGPATVTVAKPVPRQLPADISGFAGRPGHLADLDHLLSTVGHGTAVAIATVSGTAGVGKTSLVVHWAHSVVDRFPDGQLHVDLRGFDQGNAPMDPVDAVRGFLDAFRVPPQRVPVGTHAQAALYRSLVAGKRMLIVLDNARDVAQVRPLLPGSSTCMVVVTSRNQLQGLVADGSHPLLLDVMPRDEALQLLQNRLGKDRVDAEPGAVDDIIERCARLPLALAIVASGAALHPSLPLRAMAAELDDVRGTLPALHGGDAGTDARAVFSWSYRQLSEPAGRLFRLLGLHPGVDISAATAASLVALPPPALPPLLAELTRATMVQHRVPGRYGCHDLLRAYAAELARDIDTEDDRRAATGRLLDHYLHTAFAGERLLDPVRDPITLDPPCPGTTPEHVADRGEALAWFTREHPNLAAAVTRAAAGGWDVHAWQLPWALTNFLTLQGNWRDNAVVLRVGVAAARRLGDRSGEARGRLNLAGTCVRLGEPGEALEHLRVARDLYRRAGDRTGQANTEYVVAEVRTHQERYADALEHARRARDLYRTEGNRPGEARVLNAIGWLHVLLGDHRQAVAVCEQAIAMLGESGDEVGQAGAWDSLGSAYHRLGRHADAVACFGRALALCRDLGGRYDEAGILIHLGETHRAAGDVAEARRAWRLAADLLDDLDHPDAADAHALLAAL